MQQRQHSHVLNMFGKRQMKMFKSVLRRSSRLSAIVGTYVVLSGLLLGYLLWTGGSYATDVRFVGIEKHIDKINLYSSDGHRVDSHNAGDDDVDFRVIVICYNRAKSLQRLLRSVNNAFYYGDRTTVEVWLDKSSGGVVDNRTLHTALNFSFKHGKYRVFTHSNHVGIYGQWLSTWSPQVNSSEIAVILEDDVAVSPYYYKYLRLVHNKYGRDPTVNGFALQGTHIKYRGRRADLDPPKHQRVYMYPTIGTWGFSPNRKNWLRFLDWFSLAYSDPKFDPFVPGHLSTKWYKLFLSTGQADSMWTIWHIFYSWINKEFTVFPNFEGLANDFDIHEWKEKFGVDVDVDLSNNNTERLLYNYPLNNNAANNMNVQTLPHPRVITPSS